MSRIHDNLKAYFWYYVGASVFIVALILVLIISDKLKNLPIIFVDSNSHCQYIVWENGSKTPCTIIPMQHVQKEIKEK